MFFNRIKCQLGILVSFVLILLISCEDFENIEDTGETTIFLTQDFLQGCNDFNEPGKIVTVMAFVDGVDSTGQTFNIDQELFPNQSNDDEFGMEFDFVAPTQGNYCIIVTVAGQCYECCGNVLTDMSEDDRCSGGNSGNILMMGMSMRIQGSTGVPSLIRITPEFEGCDNCGC